MTVGLVAGSFDPITRGHTSVIRTAAGMVDRLYIAIGKNPDKKAGYFTDAQKMYQVQEALCEELPAELLLKIRPIMAEHGMMVDTCDEVGATIMFRGLRNPADFTYEQGIQQFNTDFAPHISTVFIMPPAHLAKLSSSAIRGLVGLKHWQERVAPYVHTKTMNQLIAKQAHKDKCYTEVV